MPLRLRCVRFGLAATIVGLCALATPSAVQAAPPRTYTVAYSAKGPDTRDVVCPSATTCHVTGFDQSTRRTVVVSTTDGGTRWTRRSPVEGYPLAMACPTEIICVLTVEVERDVTALLVTKDRGATWSRRPFVRTGYRYSVYSMECPSPRLCVAIGGRSDNSPSRVLVEGLVFRSTNGGSTWSVAPMPFSRWLTALTCVGPSRCLATSDAGLVFSSADVGATWNRHWGFFRMDKQVNVKALACSSTTACTALGYTTRTLSGRLELDAGVLLSTQDGGETWRSDLSSPSLVGMEDLECVPDGSCVAVGQTMRSIAGPAGTIGISTGIVWQADDGSAWKQGSVPNTINRLAAVSCPLPGRCIIAGKVGPDPTNVYFNLGMAIAVGR